MNEVIIQVLSLAQVLLLAAAVPLSLIAWYGFRGTSWGRVLSPLPVIEVSFALGLSMYLLNLDAGMLYLVQAILFGVGVASTVFFTYRLTRLVSGGVRS